MWLSALEIVKEGHNENHPEILFWLQKEQSGRCEVEEGYVSRQGSISLNLYISEILKQTC